MADPDVSTFSPGARLRSFGFALRGIGFMLVSQHNAWLHLAVSIVVVVAGVLLGISLADWRWLIAAMALVWFAEAINTAFEYLCDVVSPEFHPAVEKAKDIAAGAVLICSAGAALIGVLTLWPYVAG